MLSQAQLEANIQSFGIPEIYIDLHFHMIRQSVLMKNLLWEARFCFIARHIKLTAEFINRSVISIMLCSQEYHGHSSRQCI